MVVITCSVKICTSGIQGSCGTLYSKRRTFWYKDARVVAFIINLVIFHSGHTTYHGIGTFEDNRGITQTGDTCKSCSVGQARDVRVTQLHAGTVGHRNLVLSSQCAGQHVVGVCRIVGVECAEVNDIL